MNPDTQTDPQAQSAPKHAGFTPGPWEAKRRDFFWIITDSSSRVVLETCDGPATEIEGNARLAAAAPSLLAERDEWRQKYYDGLVRPDELVEKCDKIQSQFLAMDSHNADLAAENADLRKERDELRAVFELLREELPTVSEWLTGRLASVPRGFGNSETEPTKP